MVMSPWPRFLAHPVVWLLLLAYFVVPQTVDGWVGLSTVVRLCIPCPNCILKWLSREHNCLWRDSSLDALTLQQVMLLLDYCNLTSRCVTSASLLMSERIIEGKHVVFTAQRYVMVVWLWFCTLWLLSACPSVCPSVRHLAMLYLIGLTYYYLLFIITTYYCDCERVFCNSLYFMFLHFILYCGQL